MCKQGYCGHTNDIRTGCLFNSEVEALGPGPDVERWKGGGHGQKLLALNKFSRRFFKGL